MLVLALEYLTPVPYVFGYLYVGGLVGVQGRQRLLLALIAIGLTLSNLWIPDPAAFSAPNLLNRLIACAALAITCGLLERAARTQSTLARQEAELQVARQVSQMREDFNATLTHDLRTPLLGAIETLGLALQDHFGHLTATQRQVFEVMRRSQVNTLQLVETLLDVYRIDHEGLSIHCEPLDMVTFSQDAIASLVDLASQRRVTLRLRGSTSELPTRVIVYADPLQLRRVLLNLLANAIRYSPRGGQVQIELGAQDGWCTVQVCDQGPGLLVNELPLIFERLYRGSSQRQSAGTGLGLYLSRQIIQAHQGTIWASNRPEGGAVFAFRIPEQCQP